EAVASRAQQAASETPGPTGIPDPLPLLRARTLVLMEPLVLPRSWPYNLGPLSRIPLGEGKAFAVGGRVVAIFRAKNARVFATQANCPHRKGPLADGTLVGTYLACPLHGFRFDLSSGQPLANDCAALKTYPVQVNHRGEIELHLERR